MMLMSWLILSLVLCGMAATAIWARAATRLRLLAVAAVLPAMLVAGLAIGSALGFPLPYYPGYTISAGKHVVLGFKMVEGQAIYVLFDGVPPRYYRLPWSVNTAQQLQDAAARGHGVGATVKGDDDRSEPQFWPTPQPKFPPKQ